MNKQEKEYKPKIQIVGSGVLYVPASEIMKSTRAKQQLAALKRIKTK